MASINQSAASLRIIGDDLIPSEITEALGAAPTKSHVKGETGPHIVGPKVGGVRVAMSGMWILEAPDRQPEDLDGQVRFIFDQLTGDLTIWTAFAGRYKMDLFCGFFMKSSNEGLELSPESLRVLGSRGVRIGLNVYGPLSDDEETDSEQHYEDETQSSRLVRDLCRRHGSFQVIL